MTKRSRSNPNQPPRPGASPESPTPAEASRRTPLWQALLLPLAAILIFLLLLEGGLALFGVKPELESDPFVGFASNVPLFVPTPAPGGGELLSTASNKLNFFNRQSFPRQKAPDSYRIFCLGGSTTYGRPYNDTTSFAGWLRELLPMADRTKNWEVINAGGISYASYRVAHLMEELVAYQPDLFIIYTGHNEFLEERTYSQLRKVPTAVKSTVALLAKTRSWAAVTAALKGLGVYPETEKKERAQLGGEVDTILDRTVGPQSYIRDDALRDNILQHYRISLERMVELARSVGAQVIFVTPAANLKDSSPFKSEHTAGLDAASRQRSEQLLDQAREALLLKNWQGALELLETAVAFDPRHAELQYLRGQALLALERFDAAETALNLARDEDVCPLRALSPMRGIVTEVAHETGVTLVDYVDLLQRRMQSSRGHSIPGKEFFLDHVHPTIEGHKILAVALLQSLSDQGLVRPGSDWGEQAIAAVAAKIEGRIDAQWHGQALANLARVLLWAGKNEEAARLAGQAQDIAGNYRQVAVDSASILTSVYQRLGQPEQALELLHATIEKAPAAIELRLKLGQALIYEPFMQLEEAAANLLLVCQRMPNYDAGYQYFGLAMARRGRLDIAYASLMEALRLNPGNTGAQQTLAQVRQMMGGPPSDPQLPSIRLDSYPGLAPRKLEQLRRDANGRSISDGIEAEFYENGRLKRFRDLSQAVPNGFDMSWAPDGTLVSRKIFAQGKPVE